MAGLGKKLFSGDVCDILENSAKESARHSDHECIQLASSPRAHACVQSLVERQFHPIHLRDYCSVINLLLLQLCLLREQASDEKEQPEGRLSPDIDELTKLKQQVHDLKKKNKERKAKYEELYRINQQWSTDYSELSKQVQLFTEGKEPLPSLPCQQCVLLERQLHEKAELNKNINEKMEKMKVKETYLLDKLEEKDKENQHLQDECKALQLQFQEIGGLSAAMRQRDDKEELIHEMQRLRDKYTAAERDRARLQTQLNRFRQSIKQLLFDSSSNNYRTHSYTNHTSYEGTSSRSAPYTQTTYPVTNYHTSGATGSASQYDVRVPPAMSSDGYIYPKQFATRNTASSRRRLPYVSSSGYKQPPTPPGLLSRGKEDTLPEETHKDYSYGFNGHYSTHPYKPDTISEQVVTDGHSVLSSGHYLGESRMISHTSSQYLEPTMYQQDKLPSPINVPRPMSAPGSLLIASPFIEPTCSETTATNVTSTNSACSKIINKKDTPYQMYSSYPYDSEDHSLNDCDRKRPSTLTLTSQQQPMTVLPLPQSNDKACDEDHLFCPHCTTLFPKKLDIYDSWFDHVSACGM